MARLNLGGIAMDVVFKDIKNIHLSVYPPRGRVRISAPARMRLDTLRVFAISKLGWIKRQQTKLRAQERETPRDYHERESHFVWGSRYLLRVVEKDEAGSIELKHKALVLRTRPGTSRAKQNDALEEWYRAQIREMAPVLIAKYERLLGVKVKRLFVQRMKTKWGSCNPNSRSVRLNTELAKKPIECLEYIVAHEVTHLRVRNHSDQFVALLDRHLPHWRSLRDRLNEAPLSHVDWEY